MPAPEMSMKKAREVLRLKFEEEKTHRDIAASCRVLPAQAPGSAPNSRVHPAPP